MWFEKITGYRLNEYMGRVHFWTTFIGVNILFFPMHFLGLMGMPRRIPDYPDIFSYWNEVASFGSYLTIISTFIFVFNVFFTFAGRFKDDVPVYNHDLNNR